MAVKRCPTCQQTIPVACKSCPCGHIFITKKYHPSKDSEDEKHEHLPLKRLRPERIKREIPDYEYNCEMNGGESQLKMISKQLEMYSENDYDDNFEKQFERSDSFEEGMKPTKKKRGRPKGSKNKPKDAFMDGICGEIDNNGDHIFSNITRKPGRPKGSKNKANPELDPDSIPIMVHAQTNTLPPIPEEKVMSYSLILSDINEKLMTQNKIKRLPEI